MPLSKSTTDQIRKEAQKNHYVNQSDKELYAEGYTDGAEVWAVWKERAYVFDKALEKIANWELPPTGKFWDKEKTRPTSFETEWGSNGVRDYIKSIATNALEQFK